MKRISRYAFSSASCFLHFMENRLRNLTMDGL